LCCVVWVRFVPLADEYRSAGVAIIESEALMWGLEGKTLAELQELFQSDIGRRVSDDGSSSEVDREQRLRALMRAKRDRDSLDAAAKLLASMNTRSREVAAEGAVKLGVLPEEFILEWLTYEAAVNLAMLDRIWSEQGTFEGDAKRVVETLLEGVRNAPALDKGVVVLGKNDRGVVVQLFGARVVEEILTSGPESVRGHKRYRSGKVYWKSNYRYARQVVNKQMPSVIREEEIDVEGGRYVVDYAEWLEEFLRKGVSVRWAPLCSWQ
jgi:hypothetical protein